MNEGTLWVAKDRSWANARRNSKSMRIMSALRRTAVVFGTGLGLTLGNGVVRSEQVNTSERNWLSWLVKTPNNQDSQENDEPPLAIGLKEAPGHVVVWGGAFGRSPRVIQGLGQDAVKVAVSDGLGAAVNQQGKVLTFCSRNGTDFVEEITVPGRAVDVSVRQNDDELVILDAAGRVSVTRRANDKFDPAKVLEGPIRRSRIKKIRCGKEHCIAVSARGDAFSWGSTNSHGQLGTGFIGKESQDGNSVMPRKVKVPPGTKIVDAACGDQHSLFLDEEGEVFGTGDDHWAQLGISAEPWLKTHQESSGEVRKSELVMGLAGYTVAGGGKHSVMLVRDGTVFSFGFNQWGQLGHHNYSTLAPPSPIADYTFRTIAISAGDNHTCVVKENGELWCIGGNSRGQLGTGNLQPSMIWKKVRMGNTPLRPSCLHSLGSVTAVIIPFIGDSVGKD